MTDSLLFAFGFGVSILTLAALYLAGIIRSLEKSAEKLEGDDLPLGPGATKTTVPRKKLAQSKLRAQADFGIQHAGVALGASVSSLRRTAARAHSFAPSIPGSPEPSTGLWLT